MVDVYILYSGESTYLDMQIALLRRWVKGAENFFLVQGPYIKNTIRSTEMEEFGSFEGIRTILVPNHKNFVVAKFRRLERVVSYLFQELLVRKPERTSLIIHSDMIPVAPLDPKEILGGKFIGGCSVQKGGDLCANLSWVLVENRVLSFNRSLRDYTNLATYPYEPMTHQLLYYFPNSKRKTYEKIPLFYCEPGFLHLNHVSIDTDDILERKASLLEENFEWLIRADKITTTE